MKHAVVIGAGRVGLGVAAHLLHHGGLAVTVLARGGTAQDLARHGVVRIRLTDGMTVTEEELVLHVIDLDRDRARAVAAIGAADLVATAVGARRLRELGPLLAAGLQQADRSHTLDVIAFENRADAAEVLRSEVERIIGPVRHGIAGAVVDRVVAHRHPATDATPLTVVGEPTCHVAVDASAVAQDWSHLPHVELVHPFQAWFHRKLHRYSAGHATAAYLGRLKGYRFVHSAVADPEIAAVVLAAMEEGRRGLEQRYGSHVAGPPRDLQAILARFRNAALGDTTERVGRDVPRKVSRHERLIGAARGASRAGVDPTSLTLAVAAAIAGESTDSCGIPTVDQLHEVTRLTGLSPTHAITDLVLESAVRLGMDRHAGTALLSLDDPFPAWEPAHHLTRKAS